jgi:hypothetical protein
MCCPGFNGKYHCRRTSTHPYVPSVLGHVALRNKPASERDIQSNRPHILHRKGTLANLPLDFLQNPLYTSGLIWR